METVKLTIPSTVYHLSQVITGFLMLRKQGWQVEIVDQSRDGSNPFYNFPVAFAEYRGVKIAYDLWDGYQNPDGMRCALEYCDIYFKRSFDEARNQRLFPEFADKMHPLGFNYHVTCRDNPINEPLWKDAAKRILGKAPERFFTPEVFEGKPCRKEGAPKILFLTQLWDTDDPNISREDNLERERINEMRIEIVRTLSGRFGKDFLGGLNAANSHLSQVLAPELIVDPHLTERRNYIRTVHESDICIGSMGLYESVGWKTGEYVAAAKAIVNERMHFTAPGDFAEGKNYLPFENAAQCVKAVEALAADPEAVFRMKQANAEYYSRYLRPDCLVLNTLLLVKGKFSEIA